MLGPVVRAGNGAFGYNEARLVRAVVQVKNGMQAEAAPLH